MTEQELILQVPCATERSFINETVTPEIARRWLDRTITKNRKVKESRVSHYARLMSNTDVWKSNGDNIRFDREGNLIDGQHRLLACIKSGKPFITDIRCGLKHDAFDTIDVGGVRVMADILSIDSETKTHAMGAALSVIWRFLNNTHSSTIIRPSHAELRQVLRKCPGIRESSFDSRRYRTCASVVAAMHFLFSKADAEKAKTFFERLADGSGLADTDPIFRLRERMMENRVARRKMSQHETCALYIKSWNAFLTDKKVQLLRWSKQEDMPAIKGLKRDEAGRYLIPDAEVEEPAALPAAIVAPAAPVPEKQAPKAAPAPKQVTDELFGSPRQVQWARNIRPVIVDRFESAASRLKVNSLQNRNLSEIDYQWGGVLIDSAVKDLLSNTDATWWIMQYRKQPEPTAQILGRYVDDLETNLRDALKEIGKQPTATTAPPPVQEQAQECAAAC